MGLTGQGMGGAGVNLSRIVQHQGKCGWSFLPRAQEQPAQHHWEGGRRAGRDSLPLDLATMGTPTTQHPIGSGNAGSPGQRFLVLNVHSQKCQSPLQGDDLIKRLIQWFSALVEHRTI